MAIFQDVLSVIIRAYRALYFAAVSLFLGHTEVMVRSAYEDRGINIWTDDKGRSKKDRDMNSQRAKNRWDIQVRDNRFFSRVATNASMGMGEAYMDRMWDCDDIPELFKRILIENVHLQYFTVWQRFINYMELSFMNRQTEKAVWEVGQKHYDLGNDLFESFLDPYMQYSCGYWANANNLNDAQVAKMELIAQKLKLRPGMRVLDIGCGWGGLMRYLAERHGVTCVGITISKEGAKYIREKCAGLPVEVRLVDYRDLNEEFDRIVSVGMFEHVGKHNYRTFFKMANRCLSKTGIFLLHTIGYNHPEMPPIEPWFDKYIFPNGMLPYYRDITTYTDGLFTLEDWHNFGHDYSRTLLAWLQNFKTNWPKISGVYGERFYRMWTYYLQSSVGCFQSRKSQLWQIVLTKHGLDGGYRAPR